MPRPEDVLPANFFYQEEEVLNYTQNSRIIQIQTEMTKRCFDLLSLSSSEQKLILDLGCGPGLSGKVIEEEGHNWVGLDISTNMLSVAKQKTNGMLFLCDIGEGLFFKPGTFDGAISVSMLQWLCYSDKTEHNTEKRLKCFFSSLLRCLTKNASAVFQFYPENKKQTELIFKCAHSVGFGGGMVIDFPESKKAQKKYLFLTTGNNKEIPIEIENVFEKTLEKNQKKSKKKWIIDRKERNRQKGKKVCFNSKYTGRKRKTKF